MQTKICKKCQTEKEITNFYKSKSCKYGVGSICIPCLGLRRKLRYQNNKEYENLRNNTYNLLHKETIYQKHKLYRDNNKDKMRLRGQHYRKTHKEYIKSYWKINAEKFSQNRRLYENSRRKNDVNYKLTKNLRRRLFSAVKDNNKSKKTLELLGCTPEELKIYLESKFKPGMSWENYSLHGWHIDHIIPCSSFDLTKPEEQVKCFHYTNLQPLWAYENLSKGVKII